MQSGWRSKEHGKGLDQGVRARDLREVACPRVGRPPWHAAVGQSGSPGRTREEEGPAAAAGTGRDHPGQPSGQSGSAVSACMTRRLFMLHPPVGDLRSDARLVDGVGSGSDALRCRCGWCRCCRRRLQGGHQEDERLRFVVAGLDRDVRWTDEENASIGRERRPGRDRFRLFWSAIIRCVG